MEDIKQTEPIRNVSLKDLPDLLWKDLESPHARLYALLDMARIVGDLRDKVIEKLESFEYSPLIDKPPYEQLKWHGPLLVTGKQGDNSALLREFGHCDGEVVSAWLVSSSEMLWLSAHLSQRTVAFDADKVGYLLRFYDPLITPTLYRLADRQWIRGLLKPVIAWWYPVATPSEETWSRLEGEGKKAVLGGDPLLLSEELWEAMVTDPFPYSVLNIAERKFPAAFGIDCYGVRLAKIEELVRMGEGNGLVKTNDLVTFALALLEEPARTNETRWQTALRKAASDEAPLDAYFNS